MKYLMMIFTVFVLCIGFMSMIETKEYYSPVYYMVNRDTSEVVASKNKDKTIHPASLTKIMTVSLALELLEENQLEESFRLPSSIFTDLSELNASVAGFQPGEKVLVKDILYGVMLPSGADASRAIGVYLRGSEKEFVDEMNKKVKRLGLINTHFENTSGLDEPSHLSTVAELHVILEDALQHPLFREIFKTENYKSSPTNYKRDGYNWVDKNLQYAKQYKEQSKITGAKSGYTPLSGASLASTGTVDGANYLLVSSGAPYSPSHFYNVQDAIKFYQNVTGKNISTPSNIENDNNIESEKEIRNTNSFFKLSNLFLILLLVIGIVISVIHIQNKIYYKYKK